MLFLEMYEVLVVVADENQSRVCHSLLQKILNLFGKYWPGRMLMDIRLFLYLSLDDLLSHRPHQNSPAPAAVFVWTTDLDSSHQKQIFPVSSSSVQSWGCRRRPWHKLSFFCQVFFPTAFIVVTALQRGCCNPHYSAKCFWFLIFSEPSSWSCYRSSLLLL